MMGLRSCTRMAIMPSVSRVRVLLRLCDFAGRCSGEVMVFTVLFGLWASMPRVALENIRRD